LFIEIVYFNILTLTRYSSYFFLHVLLVLLLPPHATCPTSSSMRYSSYFFLTAATSLRLSAEEQRIYRAVPQSIETHTNLLHISILNKTSQHLNIDLQHARTCPNASQHKWREDGSRDSLILALYTLEGSSLSLQSSAEGV
jgi:hypothetical protein